MSDPAIPIGLRAWLQRNQLGAAHEGAPDGLLAGVRVAQRTLQEYAPLAESLEVELAALTWSSRGVEPFARGEVPFAVNNTGRLSAATAAVLFANCAEAAPAGEAISVLELGAGCGLFARHLLDSFQALCERERCDFYERLRFLVSDGSRRTVEDWMARDLFGPHAAHVQIGVCDARHPARFEPLTGAPIAHGALRAVLCNYVLDVLPAALVRRADDGTLQQLYVRTSLTGDLDLLRQYTQRTADEIHAQAASGVGRGELAALGSLFDLETEYREVAAGELPYLDLLADHLAPDSSSVLNYGAFGCVDTCLERLAPDGFILIHDAGPTPGSAGRERSAMQRFAGLVAFGVDFAALESLVHARGWQASAPSGDDTRQLHTRLLHRASLPRTRAVLEEQLSAAAMAHVQQSIAEARAHVTAGRHEDALRAYRLALARAPRDWMLLGEVAEYVGLQLGDHPAAVELARAALGHNPWYSARLWNVLGDCLWGVERHAAAHEAYLQARRIDPCDPYTNLNLAFTHARRAEHEQALRAIAVGLHADARGAYRERLLHKQQEIIATLDGRRLAEEERLRLRAARLR